MNPTTILAAFGLVSQTLAWVISPALPSIVPSVIPSASSNDTTVTNTTTDHASLLAPRDRISFKACKGTSLDTTPLSITWVDITPSPPKRDANVDIYVAARLKEGHTLTQGAKLQIRIRWLLTTVFRMNLDLCERLEGNNTCPMQPGQMRLRHVQWLSKYIPKGMGFKIQVKVVDQDKQQLACVEVPMKL